MAGTQSPQLVNVVVLKEGEADDVSFIRTGDVVCLLCSSGDGLRKGYLAADGFGSEFCYLEPDTKGEEPSELWKCTFQLEEALSVHALSTYKPKKVQRRILMYGQAVLLRHQGTKKLFRCLASSPANDKLAHHIGFSEKPGMVDGSCWFLVCPSTKQRSDGEKVVAGDNILLRSVSNERFLSAHQQSGESDTAKHSNMVLASFQQSVWALHIVCSGSAREGYVNGTDVIHLLHCHGAGDSLSVAARSCDKNVTAEKKTCSEVCYECPVKAPLRTLWRVELFQMKFGGGFTEWRQPFRLRHVVTGRFLGVRPVCPANCGGGGGGGKEGTGEEGRGENNRDPQTGAADDRHIAVLLEPREATFKTSAFYFTDATSPMTTAASSLSAKTAVVCREAMGQPQVKFGDSEVLLVHVDSGRLVGLPVTQHTRHLLGRRERRRVVVQRERHQGQEFTVTRGSEEQAKAASIIQLMETCMRRYVKKVLCSTCSESKSLSFNLIHLLDDLIHYFHLPPPPLTSPPPLSHTSHPPQPPTSSTSSSSQTHDSWQAELCLLRERQELFQKQGLLSFTLNFIIETGQSCRTRCSKVGIQIHHKLYELLTAMIRSNRKNCSEFATVKWLKVFIDQLSMPLFTHDVLEVIQCLLTDSPEVLNIITKEHVQVIVNLLLSRGRDDIVMKLLSSLCVCSDVAMRDKQRLIYQHLVDCRDLLIQTSLHDYIHCLHPGLYIGANDGGNSNQRWYYEARVTQLPAQNTSKHFHLRVGWAHPTLFQPRPSSNSIITTSGGVGDDLYSVSFNGEFIWFGGHPIKSDGEPPSSNHRKGVLQRQVSLSASPVPPVGDQEPEKSRTCVRVGEGDVIGCYLDLGRREVWFSKNGATVSGVLRLPHFDDVITPAISMSSNVSMVLSYGGSMGEFSHPPPSDYAGLCEAAPTSSSTDELRLRPFITLGTSGDLAVTGPEIHASHEGFVPAPIDTGGLSLPAALHGVRERLAQQLHEVWAKNKIDAGYTFAEERNDALKHHPMLCPLSSLSPEDNQYNHSMAYQTLATLLVLGYQIVPPDARSSSQLTYLHLDEETYRQSNGYLPRPFDLGSVELDGNLEGLVTRLAENCHNAWAATRIKQGWTYGRSTDTEYKKNPCLVPYEKLDPATKKSNWDSAHDTVRTVVALGCTIVPPSSSSSSSSFLSTLPREYSESRVKIRNFRGQTCYAVTSGKWYYEVKLVTDGMMRVGWATPSFQPHLPLGDDEHSYAFDGYLACKWHNGRESFGQRWSAGDVVGCLLDMDQGQVAFTLNGDLLQDSLGSSVTFEGVRGAGLVPVITLAAGQMAQLNFGRSEEALRSNFSSLGYKPLCSPSALHFNVPLWYSWPHESLEPLSPSHPRLLVARRPSDLAPKSSSSHCPVLSVTCRDWDYSQGAQTECLRLSAGILVTPETTPVQATPQCIHPRPGPFSPTPTAAANGWVPFADCSITPRRNVVSYTAVVPAGQDPRTVYVGWTTAQFRYISSQFQTSSGGWSEGGCEGVFGQRVECVGRCEDGSTSGRDSRSPGNVMEYSQSSAYLVCVKQLLSSFNDQNLAESVRVVCTLDLLTGQLAFSTTLPGKNCPSSHRRTLSVETRCKLFPTVITTPSTEKIIDLDFTPDLCCNSIASTLVPTSSGAKLSPCPSRFRLMALTPSRWVRQPFHRVPFTSSVTAEGGVELQSHREPSYSICATLPEEDQVMDLLELSENEKLLQFHMSTLRAYSAVSSNYNEAIVRKVAAILDPEQLLRCLKLRGMHYSLRAAYTQLFNTLHLDPEVHTKLVTRGEFILPLSALENPVPLFLPATQHEQSPTVVGARWGTPEVDGALSRQARVTHNIKSCLPCGVSDGVCRLIFSVRQLKEIVFYDLEKLLSTRYHKGTLLPRLSCSEVIVPLLTLLDNLLVAGALRDQRDFGKLLSLLHPHTFALKGSTEGLLSLQVAVEEPIKLALCSVLQHLCDCLVQHRVESTVAFAASYVASLQRDQRERYKKTFAKKPKEFRSPPKAQMEGMLSFQRSGVSCSECPTPSDLRQALQEFHSDLKRHCGATHTATHSPDNMADKTLREKLKALAVLVHKAFFSSEQTREGREGVKGEKECGLQRMVMSTMILWAQQPIHSPELIQQIFSLLYRQCDEINEVVQALQKTYVIDLTESPGAKMNFNLPGFRRALGCLRLLLKVGMGREEEQSLKNNLRTISHSGLFYCHPQLLRSLGVHLTVLGLMRSYLGIRVAGLEDDSFLTARRKMKMAMSKEGLPAPVEWCCKFLCSFARVSSDNQRALFSHISYLLEYSEKNPGCMTCRGCTPLDVATATIRDNAELCLALDDAHLHHVVSLLVSTTTSVAMGGGSLEQGGGEDGREGSVGSVACDWAPNGGEKCLDFLQCAVWADGEQIQENAYVIVRLLIHHPESLGPALAGEAIGLHRVYEDILDHMLDTPQYGSSRASPRDSSDLGSALPLRGSPDSPPGDSHATLQHRSSSCLNLNLMNTQLVLSFYTSLVRLLACCAPVDEDSAASETSETTATRPTNGLVSRTTSDQSSTKSEAGKACGVDVKKSCAERTRNILRNLISVEDVRGILSLPYAGDGAQGIIPAHKEAALLFLSRVYGVTEPQVFRELLTDAFLPDIKTALKLASSQEESPLSGPLLRYLCSSVFPLLTSCAAMLPQLLAHLHIIINLLMCCCRLGTTCQLTAKQLSSITAFLTKAYRCLHPVAIRRLLPKVIADIPSMQPHTIMYMELLGYHFSHYARYYESGQRSLGQASEEEKVLSAMVVYRLLDTLATSLPPDRLERSCGVCLQAVSCAIAPDTLLPSQCQLGSLYQSSAMGYDPRPACTERVTVLKPEVKQFVQDYANVLHDIWIFEQQGLRWTYGSEYCEKTHEDPNLKPLNTLPPEVKEEYTRPIEEAVKFLIVRGWCVSKVRAADYSGVPTRPKTICLRRRKRKDGTEEVPYEPEVLDLSKVSTPVEILAMAEMMAEEAHDRWANQLKNTSDDYQSHPFYQPYELVDDVVKEERRSYALDMLRYLRLCGFEFLRTGKTVASLAQSRQSSVCQERFSLQLFDKFLRLLSDNRDPVYYSRVLFPTLASYLNHNRKYFIPLAGQRSANSASREEKLIILRLFCKVMDYAHTHKFNIFSSIHRRSSRSLSTLGRRATIDRAQPPPTTPDASASEEKGSLFREIHHLIESIVRSLDVQAIALGCGSMAEPCPDILTFFRQALETVAAAKREMSQKKQLKNSHVQSYTLSLLIPALTVLFNHVGYRDTSRLLIQGQVLVHCRLIFQNLVEMATGVTPIFVGTSPIVVIGRCLGAFSRAYPDPFLEKQLFGFDLESLLSQLHLASALGSTAGNVLYVVDIVIPVLSNYIAKWYSGNSLDCSNQEKVDYTLSQILALVTTHFTQTGCCWFVRIIGQFLVFLSSLFGPFLASLLVSLLHPPSTDSSLALAQKCSSKLLSTHLLPMCERLRERAVALWQTEQLVTSHIAAVSSSSSSSGVETYTEALVGDYKMLVRDLATTLLFLVVFLKSHSEELREAEGREKGGGLDKCWTKHLLVREDVSRDVNALFVALADIFHCWFSSPHFRRVFLVGTQWLAQNPILKCCFNNLYPKRENQSSSNYNLITSSLGLLLPIMDQFMTRGDRDLVERYTEKLSEKGACHVAMKTELIELLQMQEQAQCREHLGHKLVRSISRTFIVPQISSAEERAEHIVGLARVRHRMKLVESPEGEGARSKWKQFFTRRKRKAVLACFLAVPYFDISKHRAINLFLETYSQQWLGSSEDHTSSALGHELLDHQDYLVTHKTASLPSHHRDPLTQLFTMIKRKATTGECIDHELFIAYPNVLSKIITGVSNDERTTSEENVTVAYQSYHKRRTELYARQNQLARRGAASAVLLVITAGSNSEVIHSILRLGIALLEEGNHLVQEEMLAQLQAMDVGFLSSVARLVASCSVLDWNAYQRCQRTEVMQCTSCLAMSKVLSGSEVTEDLFRFLQLLCEGHNAEFQNYLRTQAGNTTTVNIITCTVDYLLRLQESISDFYWHYSDQETIDLLGRDSLLRAFRVAKQVFRTLTEYIQGPCVLNQQTLARSRLLDAVSGFLQVFAVLQRKLYRDTSQVELLRELLGLQEEMFILLLSMLEGSAMSSQLGRLMVDMLVESEQWVQDIMAFFSIFIKLKDSTTSKAFNEYDLNKDGLISYREFEMAMESQQRYNKEEIAYLMECADTNNDGLLDYMEFTERFHQPAENIGFHLCVLIVHLSEHLPQEKRLAQFRTSCQGRELMEHFEQGMGCIEIQGKSGRIERVYFEVKQSRLAQWNETQIKESRKNFLHGVDMGSHKKKLEGFVSFCEDTIFEMDYADKISGSEQQSRESRAFQHRLRHTKALQSPTRSRPILRRVVEVVRGMWTRHRPLDRLKTVVLAVWTLFVLILLIPLLNFLKRAGSKLGTALSRRLAVADHSHSPERSSTPSPQTSGSRLGTLAQRKALRLSITRDQSQTTPPANVQQVPATTSTQTTEENGSQQTQTQNGTQGEHPAASGRATLAKRLKSLLPHQIQTPRSNNTPLISATLHQLNLRYNRSHMRHPSPSPTSSLPTQQGDQSLTPGMAEDTYVPKITLSTRSWQAFIARHYYRLNSVKLLVTFLINVVLLSFTVQSLSQEQSAVSDGTCEANSSLHTSAASSCSEKVELIWNPLYLKLLSLFHFLLSLLLILSYWNLKVPLIIFKREKEIARRLETKHTWLGSRPRWSPGIGNIWEWGVADWWAWLRDMWDSTVISAPSFPRNYWDKQVKDRVRSQFEGASRDLVTRQLGMGTQCPFETRSKWANVAVALNSLGDLRYFVWMVGTVLTDMMVLYHILYCGLSFLGLRSNSFYFSIHLLDLVMNFKLLRTVLYSVLHNGKQSPFHPDHSQICSNGEMLLKLLMTVLMTCVVIYLYTVIAFNYFRKFYVQQSHTSGEPVYTCDNMAKCFIYHIDKGLRAGGGIGDVLKSASGEPDEILRLLFDVTFFFFVIVILLAIIQGLIIDAFGELRDKEDSITADMKNKCFVCGLPKTEFDHVAHGFDNHITRDHNAANYMFFLQYLIRKQESEFSGQESYVWEMYLKRRWDFFPVGDSFRGQEERRQLSGPEGVASSRNRTKRPSSPLLIQSSHTSPSVVTATQSL